MRRLLFDILCSDFFSAAGAYELLFRALERDVTLCACHTTWPLHTAFAWCFTQQNGHGTLWRVCVTLLFNVTAVFLSHYNTLTLLHLFTSHRQCSDYTAKFLSSHLVQFTSHYVQGIPRYLNVTYLHHAFLCTLRTTI